MAIQSAFNSGVAAFQRATELANDSASNIASQSPEQFHQASTHTAGNQSAVSGDVKLESNRPLSQANEITPELINLRLAEHQAQAAAKVITTADEVVGSLIDTRV